MNIKVKQNIENKIIDKFILEYNRVKKDGELIDYIINNIIENLKEFNFVFLPNKCFNLLNNTFFITEVKNAIVTYKKIIKELINSILEEKAKKFLDMKAKFEIGNDNMEIKNKKTLKELKAFIEIFLKKNLYYIAQRLMISYIIDNIYSAFFEDVNKILNTKINNILNIDINPDIKILLENLCFIKLKDFSDKWGIVLQIEKIENNVLDFADMNEIQDDELKQNNNNLNTNSFIYVSNNNKDFENENDQINIIPLEKNNWFPLKKNNKLNIVKEEILISLEKYLQEFEIQDTFFNIKPDDEVDEVFSSLKTYMKNDLINFLNAKKNEFIKIIDKEYQNKKFSFEEKIIKNIIRKENISSIYNNQIEKEINI